PSRGRPRRSSRRDRQTWWRWRARCCATRTGPGKRPLRSAPVSRRPGNTGAVCRASTRSCSGRPSSASAEADAAGGPWAHPPHPRTAGLRRPRSIAVHGPLGRVGPHGVDGHVDLGGLLRLVVEVDLHLVAVFALDDLVLDVVRLVVVDRRHLVAQLLERRAVVRLVLADAEVLLELVAVGARGLQARAVADALGVAR